MTTFYRVEVHNGKRWADGIRVNSNSRVPEFCGLGNAQLFDRRQDAMKLRDDAARLCGGTLRVARIKPFAKVESLVDDLLG